MVDQITFQLQEASKTVFAGKSLADTLYRLPVTIGLDGPLGAGKTTFLQAFTNILGLNEPLVSPTYALEQRYTLPDGRMLLHIDLYRLSQKEAEHLLHTTDDHTGIRCIEWAERSGRSADAWDIHLAFDEYGNGRTLQATFRDCDAPSEAQMLEWRNDVRLPAHIAAHCDAVAGVALRIADALIDRGMIVRREAVRRAALVHDLFRFVDFRPGASPKDFLSDVDDATVWESWKQRYPDMRHESVCERFLQEQGYAELAQIVAPHGLLTPSPSLQTTEQRILYYADKRCTDDRVVTVDERFADFAHRYAGGTMTDTQKRWHAEVRAIEKLLFPDGPPF